MFKFKKISIIVAILGLSQLIFLSFGKSVLVINNVGSYKEKIIPLKGGCQKVINNCDFPIGIPLKTSAETKSFFENPPSCVVLAACNREVACSGTLPSNTEWNTSNTYIQTFDGLKWRPSSKLANYNITSSSDDCRYKSKLNYTRNGFSGVANTQTYTCPAKPSAGTLRNTVSNYTQTWDGSEWMPLDTTTTYNTTPSTTSCRYVCDTGAGYRWDTATSSCINTCAAQTINGYNIGLLIQSATQAVSKVINGTPINGYTTYNATATCNNGLDTISSEIATVSCNAGYVNDGGSCKKYQRVDEGTRGSCSASPLRSVGSRGSCSATPSRSTSSRGSCSATPSRSTSSRSSCSATTPSRTIGSRGSCSATVPSRTIGSRGSCSVSCGVGSQTRSVSCTNTAGSQTRSVSCTDAVGSQTRSVSCINTAGSQTRPVSCINTLGSQIKNYVCKDELNVTVADSKCQVTMGLGAEPVVSQSCALPCTGTTPVSSQSCTSSCSAATEPSSTTSCTSSCPAPTPASTTSCSVTCAAPTPSTTTSCSATCPAPTPTSSQSCNNGACQVCGNGIVEGSEICDGEQTCSYGGVAGIRYCSDTCDALSSCSYTACNPSYNADSCGGCKGSFTQSSCVNRECGSYSVDDAIWNCSYGSVTQSCYSVLGAACGGGGGGGGGGGCFIAGTKVSLSDGSKENIENIKVGDVLVSADGLRNKVVKLKSYQYERRLYSINGSDYFVTDSHPFMTIEGWKSFSPKESIKDKFNLPISELGMGDILVTDKGLISIFAIDSVLEPKEVYNFTVDGDHTYYADGYLVHNLKQAVE